MAALADATGATPTGSATTGSSWADMFKQAVPALISARYQDKVMKTNLKRAQQGLAPLNVEDFQPGVKVGLDPSTRNMVIGGIVGLLALGGFAIASRRRSNAK